MSVDTLAAPSAADDVPTDAQTSAAAPDDDTPASLPEPLTSSGATSSAMPPSTAPTAVDGDATTAGDEQYRFAPKTMVWAKVRGFPWWPGQVMSESMVPPDLKANPRAPGTLPIFFFGTHDYTYVRPEELKLYAEMKSSGPQSRRKALIAAVKEANLPLDVEDFFARAAVARQEIEDAAADDDDAGDEDDEDYEEPAAKRAKHSRRSLGTELTKRKRESMTSEPTRKAPRRKSTGSAAVLASKQAPTDRNRLLTLRHKLQKIFLSDPVREADFPKVDALMTEVENYEVNVDSLKETRIGKVIRRISGMTIPNEPANVVSRCSALMKQWKKILAEIGSTADSKAAPPQLPEPLISTGAETLSEETEQKMSLQVDKESMRNGGMKTLASVAVASLESTCVTTEVSVDSGLIQTQQV